jgi:iron complex transport system substrate-binding protein
VALRRLTTLAVAGLLVAGCGSSRGRQSVASGAIVVEDSRGKKVALQRPAQRVVCLIESALSGLYMLGAEDAVVGVSTNVYDGPTSRYYAAMDRRIHDKTLPSPGNWDFVSVESIVALRPDLVVIWSEQGESIAALEELGVPVFAVFLRSLDDVFREIRALGTLTGKSARAEELVAWTRGELSEIDRRIGVVPAAQRPRTYFMWAQSDLETSGNVGLVEELIERAGARNVFHDIGQEHVVIDRERLRAADPELVVMWFNDRRDPSDVVGDRAWMGMRAVRAKQVHELPEVFLCDLWTLKFPYAVSLMASWAHPDRFAEKDLASGGERMLQTLYRGKLARRAAP